VGVCVRVCVSGRVFVCEREAAGERERKRASNSVRERIRER